MIQWSVWRFFWYSYFRLVVFVVHRCFGNVIYVVDKVVYNFWNKDVVHSLSVSVITHFISATAREIAAGVIGLVHSVIRSCFPCRRRQTVRYISDKKNAGVIRPYNNYIEFTGHKKLACLRTLLFKKPLELLPSDYVNFLIRIACKCR